MDYKRINITEARDLIKNSTVQVIDIRDPSSYEAGHVGDAIHVNDHNVQEFVQQADLEVPLIVYCYHGNISQGAAQYFLEQGFKVAYSMDGGFSQWQKTPIE